MLNPPPGFAEPFLCTCWVDPFICAYRVIASALPKFILNFIFSLQAFAANYKQIVTPFPFRKAACSPTRQKRDFENTIHSSPMPANTAGIFYSGFTNTELGTHFLYFIFLQILNYSYCTEYSLLGISSCT